MTDIITDNLLKSTVSPQYSNDKTLDQTFHERALFVFNIFYDTTENELKDLFHKYGPAKVKLMMSENSNKNKGHAFIEYTDPAHAKEAVKQLNGYQLRETKIKVQFNTKQPPWYAHNQNQLHHGHHGGYHGHHRRHHDNTPSNSIYVRNLDNNITSEDLESHFGRYSPVKVSLVMDHMTKRNKGYAFVDFPTIEDATTAIKNTNGFMFFGRQLHVEYSNRGSNLDSRKSESVSSLASDLDEQEMTRSRIDREKLEDELNDQKRLLEDAKTRGCETDMQSVREQMYRLQDEIAHLRLAEQYPESTKSNSRSRSREEKRKKKRRSDEGDSYYSDETTPGMERSYTPTSFSSRRSTHRGSISSNSSQGDDNYLEHRVFVGGVNHSTTPDTFRSVFSKFGKISSYFLKWDKLTGRNKGFGFVSFDTSEQMENLLLTHKDNPVIIDGHTVNIKRVFPESYVSPFPLNIPPMLCRAAPHFSDPPPYCDERNPLPDDPKLVEFFYNLGVVHYNLLRINVYHWNLLFPGNMFSTPKLDSTPPTRQPSPAPSFPGPNLPNFSTMDQMHRAQAPLIGGGVRGMFPPGAHPGAHPHHHNTYLRPHIPMHHGPPPDLQMRFTNTDQFRQPAPPPHPTNGGYSSTDQQPQLPTSSTAPGNRPHSAPFQLPPPPPPITTTPRAPSIGGNNTNNNQSIHYALLNNSSLNPHSRMLDSWLSHFSSLSRSHSQYGGGGSTNNNSNHVKRSNSYSNPSQTNNSNNHYHQSFIQHQNSMQQPPPTNHNSFTHSRSALDTIPLRMQHLTRHIDTRKAPEKVSPSNFSPTTAFSPDAFSPNKIMVNHSSPPDAVGDTQNNSSYGSHEDTLTYEPSVDQSDYPPSQSQQNQHGSFHQGHAGSAAANLLHELALSPGSNPSSGQQQQQHRQNERSRSSSGSYNDHVMNRNAPASNGGNGPNRIMMDKKDMMSKESMDLMYLRNIQHLSQPTSSYHPSLHDLDKTRLDTRSPHGIQGPPPGDIMTALLLAKDAQTSTAAHTNTTKYNPMQVVGNLPFPSSIHTLLYNPRPGLISPLQPQQLIRGFPSSPTQSEDESDDDRQQ